MNSKLQYVDTNVIVRYLTGDIPELQRQAQSLFRSAEKGELKLALTTVVVAETCFVLESFYKKSREDIAVALKVITAQRWLQVPEREVLGALWSRYLSGFHFVDSYLLTCAEVFDGSVATFDRQLAKSHKSRT